MKIMISSKFALYFNKLKDFTFKIKLPLTIRYNSSQRQSEDNPDILRILNKHGISMQTCKKSIFGLSLDKIEDVDTFVKSFSSQLDILESRNLFFTIISKFSTTQLIQNKLGGNNSSDFYTLVSILTNNNLDPSMLLAQHPTMIAIRTDVLENNLKELLMLVSIEDLNELNFNTGIENKLKEMVSLRNFLSVIPEYAYFGNLYEVRVSKGYYFYRSLFSELKNNSLKTGSIEGKYSTILLSKLRKTSDSYICTQHFKHLILGINTDIEQTIVNSKNIQSRDWPELLNSIDGIGSNCILYNDENYTETSMANMTSIIEMLEVNSGKSNRLTDRQISRKFPVLHQHSSEDIREIINILTNYPFFCQKNYISFIISKAPKVFVDLKAIQEGTKQIEKSILLTFYKFTRWDLLLRKCPKFLLIKDLNGVLAIISHLKLSNLEMKLLLAEIPSRLVVIDKKLHTLKLLKSMKMTALLEYRRHKLENRIKEDINKIKLFSNKKSEVIKKSAKMTDKAIVQESISVARDDQIDIDDDTSFTLEEINLDLVEDEFLQENEYGALQSTADVQIPRDETEW